MFTIGDKTYLTTEDTSPLKAYDVVVFTSWKEANDFLPVGIVAGGYFLRRDIFEGTPGFDAILSRKGYKVAGLFAPGVK